LVHHFLRRAVCGQYEVDVVRPHIEGVNVPAANATVVLDHLRDEGPLVVIECDGGLRHPLLGNAETCLIRRLDACATPFDPTAIIAV
jgi:hypothetical protein